MRVIKRLVTQLNGEANRSRQLLPIILSYGHLKPMVGVCGELAKLGSATHWNAIDRIYSPESVIPLIDLS